MNFRLCVCLALILAFAALAPAADLATADLATADQAFAAHDLTAAYTAYVEIATHETDRRIVDQATVKAALIEWRYRHEMVEARTRLLAALPGAHDAGMILRELAVLEINAGRFAEARTASQRALLCALTAEDGRAARELYARATITQALAHPDDVVTELTDTHLLLATMIASEPGQLEPSLLLLRSALLLDDGPAALQAIRSYYRLAGDDAPFNNIDSSLRELLRILPEWRGPESTPLLRGPLARALAGACLFSEAAMVAADPRGIREENADIADIVAYAHFIEQLGALTDEYYRLLSLGIDSKDAWLPGMTSLLEELRGSSSWGAALAPIAHLANDRENPEVEAAVAEISSRYRAHVNLGTTAGYLDLHYGHEIADESRPVSTRSEDGSISLITLDQMVSNGFQSWAWNYQSQHGGWAKQDAIVDIRPAGAGGAIIAWRMITEPSEMERLHDRLTLLLQEDGKRAVDNPYAYLPGLRLQLQLLGAEQLRNELMAKGLRGAELRAEFVAAFDRQNRETAIFAHEGRHVIDKRVGITDGAELEYRAKISEVLASSTPHGTFARAVLGANTGDQTPHGKAQLRIISALVAWMQTHGENIDGFDRSLPLLPQMYRLTPAQLRSFLSAIDPANAGS